MKIVPWTVLALGIGLAFPAHADGRGWGHGGGHGWGGWNRPRGPVIIHKHEDAGAGFLGGIVGGVIGGILTSPPAPPAPPPVIVDDEELEPWSKAWFVYCSRKYKSFDPEDGTFTGYDGEKKFCR